MTTAPYSDEWRRQTRARLFPLGMSAHVVGERTGLGDLASAAILGAGEVSHEVSGPIDELLDALERGDESPNSSRTLAGRAPPAPEVRPVAVESLSPLLRCTISMWERER